MAVQFIASTTCDSLASVEVRAIGSPFESVNQPGRYFLNVLDSSDMIFITGLGNLGSMLMLLKKGNAYRISNVLVEKNHPGFVDRFPFSDTRLVVTSQTVIETLPKNYPGLPSAVDGSVTGVELTATRIVASNFEGTFKYVKVAMIDDQNCEWFIKLHGPFYRQWVRSVQHSELPLKIAFNSVEKDGKELRLMARSRLRIIGSAPSSPMISSASSEEPDSCSESKKRKREFSSESYEDEGERQAKKIKTEGNQKCLVSYNAVSPACSEEDELVEADKESKLTTWQLGEDRVLVITTKEHFDRMARTQETLTNSERPSSFWRNAARLGFFAAVAALGGLYIVTPDKIVVFLSLANFFKVIV